MVLAFIHFDPQFAGWSAFTFWVVVISIVITLGFTGVVFYGGIGDLKFLLASMDQSSHDQKHDNELESEIVRH